MILIHSYFPEYIAQLFRCGIAQKGDGFKINQHYRASEDKKFNELAKEGSDFYHFVKENASCIYVDRLQGGTFYHRYDPSKEVIDLYENMPGVDFLGFQLHELATTRANDWKRIDKCLREDGLQWNEKNIYESVRNISPNKEFPFFSQGPAGEYAARTMPKNMSSYIEDLDYIIETRQKATYGNILKCDSFLYCSTEEKYNIRVNFVEVGAQIKNCRIQFAMRRGISRKNGSKWGTYIEPWGGKPTTTYLFARDGANDWHRPRYKDGDANATAAFKSSGENGGSSMSFAGRLMFYTLFSGSDYFSEEWGAANTFYSWETGELSPYGTWKLKMADLSRRLRNLKAEIPIAIILPKDYKIVMPHGGNPAFENDLISGEYPDIIRRISRLFYSGSTLGAEDAVLTVGRYGSIFDIIYDDTYEHPEQEYPFLVDFSGKFAGKLPNAVDAYDEEALYQKLDAFVAEYLPFSYTAHTDIDYCLFENDGHKYCCIFNHNGVSKTIADGEWVNPDATNHVCLQLKKGKIEEVIDYCDLSYTVDEGTFRATFPGGTFIVLRYS